MIPPGDFFTNLAVEVVYDLLKAGLSRLQTLVRGSPEEQALKRALLSGQFLHVTGERAVAFGADASDVVVVTGDNDIVQVFKGPDADAIRRIFRQILDEIATDRYAASLQEYFAALRRYCANLPYLTLHDIRPPKNLDEVYVPLLAKRRLPEDRESHEVGRPLSADEPIPIAQVLQKADTPHLLILGEPGAGKSTLLRQLAERAWDNPRAIGLERPHLPMLVPLRHLALKGGVLDRRLAAALGDELALVEAPPEGFFRAWSQQMDAPWLLLLDGLDEVPAGAQPHLMQWLQGMLPLIGSGRVVITGRLSAYEWREWDEKQFSVYNLLPFTEEQTRMFAEKWFGAEAPDFLRALEKVRAAALSGTPLLLTIAAKIYLHRKEETGVGSLPERRSQLYEEFINIWLKEAELRGLSAELGDDLADVAKPALARLALTMTEDHTLTDEDRLVQVVAEYLGEELPLGKDQAEAKGRRFVQVMGRRSGVFLRREYHLIHVSVHADESAARRLAEYLSHQKHYGWFHSSFREYLAAWLIVEECKRQNEEQECVWKRAVSRWADERYWGVSEFAIGIFGGNNDVTVIIQRLLDEDWVSESMAEWLAWQPVTRHYLFQGELGALAAGAALLEGVKVKETILCEVVKAVLRFHRSSTLYKDEFGFIVKHPAFQQLLSRCASVINDERGTDDEEETHS